MKHPVIKAELEKYPDSRSPKISKNVLMKSQSQDKPTADSDTEEREDDESNLQPGPARNVEFDIDPILKLPLE